MQLKKPVRSIIDFSALFWSMKMLNFLILHPCNGTTNAYTYFPFGNGHCRKYNEENIIKLGSLFYDPLKKGISFTSEYTHDTKKFNPSPYSILPFFPDKIPLDLNQCPINLTVNYWPPKVIDVLSVDESGIEVEFIKTMAKHINSTVIFSKLFPMSEFGLRMDENEEHVGQLAKLKEELYDLAFGEVPLHYNVLRDFDATDCFQENTVTFVVPRAGIRPSQTILWILFEKHSTLFLSILVSVGIMSLMINSVLKLSRKTHQAKKSDIRFILEVSGTLLRSLIETTKPKISKNKIIQLLYGMWFGCCVIITSYFNTTLTTFFTQPEHVHQMKTVKNIVDSEIPIVISDIYPSQVFEAIPKYGTYIAKKKTKSSVPLGLKLASMGNAVTLTDVMRAQHISVQWVSSTGESSIYYLHKDFSMRHWNIMIMYRGNPLLERVTDIVSKISQTGFSDFQQARYYNRRVIRTMIRQYLITYNYIHNINNTLLINHFNELFTDSLRKLGRDNETRDLLLETNEEDIIRRFVRNEKIFVTWDHLRTVFHLWGVGMTTAMFIFIAEQFRFARIKINFKFAWRYR